MTKQEIKELEDARKTGNAAWIGRKLAILHRCASPRSAREIAGLIEGSPEIRATVTFDGNCYVGI